MKSYREVLEFEVPQRRQLLNITCLLYTSYEKSGVRQHIVKRLRKNGVSVFAWTVRSEEEWNSVQPYIDSLVFEQFEPKGGQHAQ